jgi:outer membrane lipoprotein-sorting protein/peroxiredoxin
VAIFERVPLLTLGFVALVYSIAAQEPPPDPTRVAKAIEDRFAAAQEYTYDATLELTRKLGEEQPEEGTAFKVKVASASQGRFLLWVSVGNDLRYLIVSDGHTAWAYSPALHKYARLEAAWAGIVPDPDEVSSADVEDRDRSPILCSQLVVPILSRLLRRPSLVEMTKIVDVGVRGEERQFPILSVLSERTEQGSQTLTEIAVDPATTDPIRLDWTKSDPAAEEPRFAVLKVGFEKFLVDGRIPPSYFTFSPPGDAESADELPLPGLSAGALSGAAAPDFEISSGGGAPARLSSLRGRYALLVFLGKGGSASRRQMSAVTPLQTEYKDKLTIVEIAVDPSAFRDVPAVGGAIVADSGALIHRLYRIEFAPTMVIVDRQGKVVKFLPGGQDTSTLKDALKAAGLSL